MSDNQPLDRSENNKPKTKFVKTATIARGAERIGPQTEQSDRRTDKILSGTISRRTFVKVAAGGAAVAGLVLAAPQLIGNALPSNKKTDVSKLNYKGKVSDAQRRTAAAARPLAATVQPTVVPTPRRNS